MQVFSNQEFIKKLQLFPQTIELLTILSIKYSGRSNPLNNNIKQIKADFINICKHFITVINVDDNKFHCPFEEKDFQHIDAIKQNLASCNINSESNISQLIQKNINDIINFIRTTKQFDIAKEHVSKIKENILLVKYELFY
ncbi:hypothetical protein N9C35_02120 [Flavobacteriaceae bacterium]|nr:hypothetical protein [Flavobacteriaceae bacterium]